MAQHDLISRFLAELQICRNDNLFLAILRDPIILKFCKMLKLA